MYLPASYLGPPCLLNPCLIAFLLCALDVEQTIKDAHHQTGWLETCGRTVASDGTKGASPIVR